MEWLTRNGYADYSREKYSATDDQVAEYERLVDELKAEIAKIPEPDHEPTVLDMRDNEPYQRLTDEYLDKIVSCSKAGTSLITNKFSTAQKAK